MPPLLRSAALALTLAATGCAVHDAPPVVFSGAVARYPEDVEARIRRIEARADLAARMARDHVPGVSVAVIEGGVVAWARGYGVQEAGGSARVTEETVFQAASVSKSVSAVAALRLVQDGRAALDEDINQRLTTWKLPVSAPMEGHPVTLRGLLSHSAGINVHGFGGYASGARLPTLHDVLDGRRPANNAPIRCEAPPGRRAAYSGGGFIIAQQLVSDVTAQPFADVMESLVLAPLGMRHSTFAQPLPPIFWPHAAAAHDAQGVELPGRWHSYPELAAAGLWTTPTDLSRVVIEIQSALSGGQSRLLGQPIAAQMVTHQLHAGNAGLGVFVTGHGNATRFEHGGVNAGFRSTMVGLGYTGQGAVVMSNADSGTKLDGEIVRAIAAEYGWPSPDDHHEDDDAALAPEDDDGDLAAALALLSSP